MIQPLLSRPAVLLLLLASASASAATLELTSQVFQEVQITAADGSKKTELVRASQVEPGSEVLYVIRYQNKGTEPADKVVITNPVPPELEYRDGSATGSGSVAAVSVDGGRTYGRLQDLRVPVAGAAPRAAQAADVTHLRWTLQAPVPPAAQGQVTYRARLK